MALGDLLKQARLEAGLSQRQLCGELITRNMLSQIENGSAKPSMETLRILSARLGKPISYFLEEQVSASPNQPRLNTARTVFLSGSWREALEALAGWQEPDPALEPERRYLEALAALRQSEAALDEGRIGYALELLERAKNAGSQTVYYTPELERRRLSLCYRAQPENAALLSAELSGDSWDSLLPAEAALQSGDPARCGLLLDAAPCDNPRWQLLKAEACFQTAQYGTAAEHYAKVEEAFPEQALRGLEACFRELEDYKMAYFYACKLRDRLQ